MDPVKREGLIKRAERLGHRAISGHLPNESIVGVPICFFFPLSDARSGDIAIRMAVANSRPYLTASVLVTDQLLTIYRGGHSLSDRPLPVKSFVLRDLMYRADTGQDGEEFISLLLGDRRSSESVGWLEFVPKLGPVGQIASRLERFFGAIPNKDPRRDAMDLIGAIIDQAGHDSL